MQKIDLFRVLGPIPGHMGKGFSLNLPGPKNLIKEGGLPVEQEAR